MLNSFGSKYNYFGLGERMSTTFFSTPSTEFTQQNPNADEIQISGVKVRKEQESSYQNNVYFRDPLNNAYVNVGLSDENLSKLKEVFGENAVKSEGNQILLKGKAEEFVSSWYADIAYKRGYIKADENNDGFLNIEERKKTNSFSEGILVSVGKDVFFLNDDKFYQKFSSINSEDEARINQYTSSSIEEEFNRMIELDKDTNGSLTLEELWQGKYTQYLDKVMEDAECKGYVPPSFEEVFYALIETMEESKELVEEELQKAGIDASTIDLTASAEEVFKNIMSQENGAEALNNIKERLENKETQSSANLNETQEASMPNSSTTQENSTTSFANEQDEATFNEIAKLTKLDKETLAYNLAKNQNFEEDIISIVGELTQNVDSLYSSNTLNLSKQKALDIRA